MRYLFFLCSITLILTSCSTGGSTIKGITALATRTDCKGPCGKTMPCEGKPLSIEIELRNRNVLQGGRTLFVRDPDNYDYTIKIEFAETVPDNIYNGIMDAKYKRIRLTGIVGGYDIYVHETCTRSYIFTVKDAKDFSLLTE